MFQVEMVNMMPIASLLAGARSLVSECRSIGAATVPPAQSLCAGRRFVGIGPEPRGVPVEVNEKLVVADIVPSANGKPAAQGQVIAVRMPDTMKPA
jgi:hypothetical protein